jgi:uncharacterized Zn finger protein
MPMPCCPKCSKTHFLKSKDASLKVVLVYCAHCGSVVSAIAIRKTQGGTTTGGGKTSQDDWDTPV